MSDQDDSQEQPEGPPALDVIELYAGVQGFHVGLSVRMDMPDDLFQAALARVAFAERYLRASRMLEVQVVTEEEEAGEGEAPPEAPAA